jgi:hypothetical protein
MAMSAPGHSLNLNVMMQSLSGLFRFQWSIPRVISVAAPLMIVLSDVPPQGGVLACKVLRLLIMNYVIGWLLIPLANILSGNIIF